MQKIYKLLLVVVLMTAVIQLSSCKKDEVIAETEEEIFINKISGSWNVGTVMLDGKDVSTSFPGLKIAIADSKQVTVTNAVPPIWNGTGTFILEPVGNSFQLKRNDGVVMTLTQPSASKMILKFLYDADALGGRIKSVTGEFTFEFTKP